MGGGRRRDLAASRALRRYLCLGYEASCSDGTNTYTATTGSALTVTGLTNDVGYACSVVAINGVGESVATVTTEIVPEPTAQGLPIWLLYEASQSSP